MYDDIPCNSTTMLDFFQYPGSNDMAIAIQRYRTLFGAFQSKNIIPRVSRGLTLLFPQTRLQIETAYPNKTRLHCTSLLSSVLQQFQQLKYALASRSTFTTSS